MPQIAHLRAQARNFYVNRLLSSSTAWRYGLNARRAIQFATNKPKLDREAKKVLHVLNRDGAAKTTLAELTGDPDLFPALQAEARRLETAKQDVLDAQRRKLASAELGDGNDKSYVVTMLDHDRPVIQPDGLLARLALHPQIKGLADHYYGLRTDVADVNIWRNLPTGKDPVASQLWHRDQIEDHLILKMFIYLEDVEEGSGPFAYVKGTHGKGDRKWNPPSTFDGHNWRASDEVMEARVEADRRPRFVAPAGTVLFADTIGWHRGGHATTKSRFVVQALFASGAALPDRMLGAPKDLDVTRRPRELKYDLRKSA